jgi:hypothetical protein
MKRIFGMLLAIAAALSGGCSGINATKSISPLDFILPGLMENRPSPSPVADPANTAPLLAKSFTPVPPLNHENNPRTHGDKEPASSIQ